MQRKDRGDSVRSSAESIRGPASVRAPSLRDIDEDHRFAIGDGEDEDDGGEDAKEKQETSPDTDRRTSPTADTATTRTRATSDGTPAQTISEKARGKQPAAANTTLATTSRNTSTSSLPSLTPTTALAPPAPLHFRPTQQWLDAWISQLPLNSILASIDQLEAAGHNVASSRTSAASREADADLPKTSTESQRGEQRGQARQSTQHARDGSPAAAQTAHGANGQGHLESEGTSHPRQCATSTSQLELTDGTEDSRPAAGGPVTFQWTAVAIGWYSALIWSKIYLQEAEAFQGPGGLYSSTDIRLFRRQGTSQQISLRSPKGAIDAVGNSLAQRISSISISKPN